METTDLMTNDLVSYQGYTFGIVEIYKDSVKLDGGDDIIVDIDDDDLQPIPLTKEILKKNGFREDIDGGFSNSTPYRIFLYYYPSSEIIFPYAEFVGIYIKYVHELQHAFRLCGLNELADNLKS